MDLVSMLRLLLLGLVAVQCSAKDNPCATGYARNDAGQCVPMEDDGGGEDDTGDGEGAELEGDDPGECSDGADNDRDGLFDCDDPDCAASPDCETTRYHPEGFDNPAIHGQSAKHQDETCRSCHGTELEGGTGNSCDECHPSGWRSDCTFCHGGTDNTTGAPPEEIDGSTDPVDASFRPHSAHVVDTAKHRAFSCAECHVEPLNVLTPGHFMVNDDTPGQAEVDFSAGRSPEVFWNNGTCSDVYCHGNGQGANGEIDHDAGSLNCQSCHPNDGSLPIDLATMSGAHEEHMSDEVGLKCFDCHADTVGDDFEIIGLDKHVNRTVDVAFSSEGEGMTWTGTSCSGGCHSHSETWTHGSP